MSELEARLGLEDSFDTDETLLKFDNCPYNCVEGKIYNPYQQLYEPCPYCSEKRKKIVVNGARNSKHANIDQLLNLPKSITGPTYDLDSILPEDEKQLVDKESLTDVLSELDILARTLAQGLIPEHSYLFYLGNKVFLNSYIYTLMTDAYTAGLKLAPLTSAYDLIRQKSISMHGRNDDYTRLIDSDILVITLESGSTDFEIENIAGIMQLRGHKGLPTIILSYMWSGKLNEITDNNILSQSIAKLYKVNRLGGTEGIRGNAHISSSNPSLNANSHVANKASGPVIPVGISKGALDAMTSKNFTVADMKNKSAEDMEQFNAQYSSKGNPSSMFT